MEQMDFVTSSVEVVNGEIELEVVMKKVLVIMGTYNGERYVSEQLQSILNQEGVLSYVLVRDDASKDRTPSILKEFKEKYPDRIQLFLGDKNLNSYYEIVKMGNIEGFDYYAFSDHDDVWFGDKLIVAIEKLKELDENKPCLYYSNLAVTDENLNFKFNVYGKNKIAATPESCFVDIAASGNTFVFNRKALDVFVFGPTKKEFYWDVWFELVIFFVGCVVYDDIPHIWFRRTGSNVSGPRERGFKLWYSRAKKVLKEKKNGGNHMHSSMAQLLIQAYSSQMDYSKIEILKEIANYQNSFKDKIVLLFDRRIRSLSFSRNITFLGRAVLNLL